MVALPLAAHADTINGLYIGAGAGINLMQHENLTSGNASGSISSKVGPAVVLSLGWGFGNGLRAEIEADYRSNSYNSISGFGGGNTAVAGSEQKFGGMANALYDFDVSPWVTPYIGAGVGYQAANWQGASFGGTPITGDKGSFAYQGILGAAFPISAVPGLAATAEYRFMGLAGNRNYTFAGGGTVTSTSDYNHSFLLGVRYAFGAPPAPMAPAAAPAPAAAMSRSYLVFFDWDKSNLTDRARGIIRDAATNSTKVAYTKIDVDGNADTTGTHAYNMALSMRRAQAVAGELVKDGVPKAAIAITASGDTHLLVPTGPGVREPQNRRVEINIR
jgi:outer membrane protein OmpA-like peptidoglycan-associated protein